VASGSFSADEDLSDVFAVWQDTRDGPSRIYWKRTDTVTAPPTSLLATPVPCASGGGLSVTWTPPPSPPHCDVERYRVEYGLSPGVYDRSLDVAAPPAILPAILEGARHYLRVLTVDEACNESPSAETSGVAPDCGGVPPCPFPVGWTLRVAKNPAADAVLTWVPPPRARDGYSPLANGPGPSHADPGAALPGAPFPRHFYLIVSRNACGSSGDEPLP
jgi:hypothetical protein